MKNPGIIYETDTGEFALALNREQHIKFEEQGMLLIRKFADRLCTIPIGDKPVLKKATKLNMIGFWD